MNTVRALASTAPWRGAFARFFRVVSVGTILALFAIFIERPLAALYDRWDSTKGSWAAAEISISVFTHPTTGKPMIWYAPHARREISGIWNAWIEVDLDPGPNVLPGTLGTTAKGTGSYSPKAGRKLRSWTWFFEESRPVPSEPYRICVFYNFLSDSGIRQITPNYCSPWVTKTTTAPR